MVKWKNQPTLSVGTAVGKKVVACLFARITLGIENVTKLTSYCAWKITKHEPKTPTPTLPFKTNKGE